MRKALLKTERYPTQLTDRRLQERHTLVLRVGLLEIEGNASFCLLKNISSKGVQVKLYSPLHEGTAVSLRVGDEDAMQGRAAWVRDGNAGITFEKGLDPGTLLRVRQMISPDRRRSSPRINARARATLRTGGRTYAAELCDLSTTGAKIRTRRPIETEGAAILVLRNLPGLRTYVRWTDGHHCGLVFESPIPIQIIAGWLSERGAA